jgi:phenylacetate-CoA ligase
MKWFLHEIIFLLLLDFFNRKKVRQFFLFFVKSYSWSEQQIKEYHSEQLRKLIIHAFENVEFYRNRFIENKLNPYTMVLPNDMTKIPPLTREDVQKNLQKLIAKKEFKNDVYKGSSSGSTGMPVTYYHDISASSSGRAAGYFGWKLTGWKIGDVGIHIWGNPTTVNFQWKKLSSRIKSKVLRVDKYPAYRLSEGGKYQEITKKLIKNKYSYIDGYTNAIYLLSKYINDNHLTIPKVKRVLTTGENLHDYQKIEIEKALGPVFDCYGCGEINGIAYESKYGKGYTIIETNVYVERDETFSSDDGTAPLIVTHLHNYIMPLIRYQNGDLISPILESDSSFFNFKRFENISGRVSDIIQLSNGGNLVVPSFFGSKLLRLIKGINQYQIIRTSENEIEIHLALDQPLSKSDEGALNQNLNDYLAGKINYSIVYVEKIPVGKNGKYKLLIDKTQ